MKYQRLVLVAAALSAIALLTASDLFGQRFGGGRGGARFSGGGGGVVGAYGGGAAYRGRDTAVGPAGGYGTSGWRSGSYTTNRGTTVDYAGAGTRYTGPAGGTVGRGVGGVEVTGAGGRTATKVGSVGGAVGPAGNGIVRGGTVGAATGPRGTVVGGSRAGVASGAYGGLSAYSARGGVAVGHRTNYIGAATLHSRAVAVRTGFGNYNCFSAGWYRAHPVAWRPAAWTAAAFWTGVGWGRLSVFCGYPVQPIIYDYGTTIVYNGDNVYYDGEPIATAADYTQQAMDIAAKGTDATPSDKDDWQSLGVWGMVQGDEKDANNIFQLAINKDGIIRGNYYNALTDTTTPVSGSVDSKTQRAAWIVGDQKDVVYETGIGNLSENETSLLVHFGKDRTQQWMLVRLEKPEDQK